MPPKLFSFTLLSKNAPASHLESHSCKNKGLKVPCFHTLTKNIQGEGVLCLINILCLVRPANHESRVANQHSLFVTHLTSTLIKNASATPLTSTLTKTKDLKSFIINTYKKGVGPPVTSHESQVQRDNFRPALWYPNQRQWNPT